MTNDQTKANTQEDTNDAVLPSQPSGEEHDREKLEADVLTAAVNKGVENALRDFAGMLLSEKPTIQSSIVSKASDGTDGLRQEFERGLKAIMSASCDARLKSFHWMVMRLRVEGTALELVEWIFLEAENQKNESEGEDKEIIEAVFGV